MGDNVKLPVDGETAAPVEMNQAGIEEHEVKYPYNKIYKYESGHILEFNNTPNNEYVRIAHKTGSEIFITKDGDIVIHSLRNANTYADGDVYIEAVKDLKINVGGNMDVKVQGDLDFDVRGELRYKLATDIELNSFQYHDTFDTVEHQDMNDIGVW